MKSLRSTAAALFLAATLPAGAHARSLKLIVYDASGRVMDLKAFCAQIVRQDQKPDPASASRAVWANAPDGLAGGHPKLSQAGDLPILTWDGPPRVTFSLPWPIAGDGFSTIWLDNAGRGFSDGDAVYVNEEIARTQYRLFKEALERHEQNIRPPYRPTAKAAKAFDRAREALAGAEAAGAGGKRARAFDEALKRTATAWEKLLFEHGVQAAIDGQRRGSLRFGLTLDASLLDRLGYHDWILDAVRRSGANWVRLVFRPNPADFTYSRLSSFNEYDAIVKRLRASGLRIMGCILDTNQWPATLTPAVYAQRVNNLVFHYEDSIKSWEVGLEVNGDWLGGSRSPLSTDQVFHVVTAAAAKVKEIEPGLETVVTLYWWGPTAPDEGHSLFGWLSRYAAQGFGRDIDVIGLSLQPDDSPVGLAFDPIFERTRQFFPDKKLLLSSFGYAEGKAVSGYWWLDPKDAAAARRDLVILYTSASCAESGSLCGGFWWQTLDQMIPARHRATDLLRAYERTLTQLGRSPAPLP